MAGFAISYWYSTLNTSYQLNLHRKDESTEPPIVRHSNYYPVFIITARYLKSLNIKEKFLVYLKCFCRHSLHPYSLGWMPPEEPYTRSLTTCVMTPITINRTTHPQNSAHTHLSQ
jgi:hypothetical protein